MNRIESRNNGIIKSVAALKDCSGRRAAGRFFFEGAHLLEEYLRSGRTPRALFVREDALARYSSLAGRAGCEVYEVTAPVYEKLTEEKAPQGILAVADTLPEIKEIGVSNAAEVIGSFGGGHAVVLENLQDPGNVGTIIRTAAAFGSSVVLCSCADIYSVKTLRAAMGALFFCRAAVCRSAETAVNALHACGRRVISAALYGRTLPLGGFEIQPGDCFVIGSEGGGVSQKTLDMCDFSARIPMTDSAESLNAAAAAAVFLWEAGRSSP
ncbi:MAG: RNA methyltransferase [Clostridia bacterium]|nr:RNA methyltransferase [Clostridia bacterium]